MYSWVYMLYCIVIWRHTLHSCTIVCTPIVQLFYTMTYGLIFLCSWYRWNFPTAPRKPLFLQCKRGVQNQSEMCYACRVKWAHLGSLFLYFFVYTCTVFRNILILNCNLNLNWKARGYHGADRYRFMWPKIYVFKLNQLNHIFHFIDAIRHS